MSIAISQQDNSDQSIEAIIHARNAAVGLVTQYGQWIQCEDGEPPWRGIVMRDETLILYLTPFQTGWPAPGRFGNEGSGVFVVSSNGECLLSVCWSAKDESNLFIRDYIPGKWEKMLLKPYSKARKQSRKVAA